MTMYTGLLHLHSLLRWIFLMLLVFTVAWYFISMIQKSEYNKMAKNLGLFTMILAHLQLVIGLVLYFVSPTVQVALADMAAAMKDANLRFWAIEHILTMILGIIFVTLGYSLSKRAKTAASKYKSGFIFFGLGLFLILLRFPWDRI